jgi:hypothetical protein
VQPREPSKLRNIASIRDVGDGDMVIGHIGERCKTGWGGELAWLLEGMRVVRQHRKCDSSDCDE